MSRRSSKRSDLPLHPRWKPVAWRLLIGTVGSLFLANLTSAPKNASLFWESPSRLT